MRKKKSDKAFHDLRRRLARNVARLRRAQGFTFVSLGERTGLHWRHLQKIEAGETNATLATIARLANGFSIDACDLMNPRGKAWT